MSVDQEVNLWCTMSTTPEDQEKKEKQKKGTRKKDPWHKRDKDDYTR